jgi:hydrogenase nickel incorporation protein HypA/HybF
MHEIGLLRDVIEKIQQVALENNAEQVTKVTLELGALAHISADHLREHFEEWVRGTMIEPAELIIHELTDSQHPHAQEIILRDIEVAVPE